jgi:3-oxoacyl-[acyl-carrier-protein] synthase-3
MRLAALACHVPERRIDTETIVTSAGGRRADAKVFTKLFGLERVAASEPGEPPRERFAPVLRCLARSVGTTPIDALIYVHGLPTHYAPGISTITEVCASHLPLFSSVLLRYEVDQNNCAGIFWALQMARELLVAELAHCIAIVAGDCLADFSLEHRYVPGCTLIGDAFAGLLLDTEQGGMQIGEIVLSHRAEFAGGLYGTETEIRRFNEAHDQMVTDALDAVGFPWNGKEKLLPHNVNKLIWQHYCRKQRLDMNRIQLDLVRDRGHCYTTDPVLLLHGLLAASKLEGVAVTLLSTGLGAYTGACRIHLREGTAQSPAIDLAVKRDRQPIDEAN